MVTARLVPSQVIQHRRRPDARALVGAGIVLAALLGTLLGYQRVAAGRAVLVITRALPAGAVLTADDVRGESVRVGDDLYAAAIPALEAPATLGRALAAPVYPHEILLRAQLRAGPALAPGQEAFTIPVPPDTGGAGRLQPGGEVSVLWVRDKGSPDATGEVLLERALVLAVAEAPAVGVVSTGEQTAARPGPIVALTLAVTREQALALVRAKQSGQLDVAVLPPADGTGRR